MNKPEPLLWLGDQRGQFIPRDFANSFSDRDNSVSGVSIWNWTILEAGPDHELYWDAWAQVCDEAIVHGEDGDKYHVEQDGDCWLIPFGMVFNEEGFWEWPEEEEEEEEAA